MQPSIDDLRALLTRVRRRWMTARSMAAFAQATGVALALLVAVLAADRFLRPSDPAMVALALVSIAVAALFAIRRLWPLRRTPSDAQIARFIEEKCPDLEDRLASATEVVQAPRSTPLSELMVDDAATKARTVDIDRVVAAGHVRSAVIRGVAAMFAFLVVFMAGSGQVGRIARTAWLYAFPFSATLHVEPGDTRVVAGDPMRIVARIDRTLGAPLRTPPAVTLVDAAGDTRTLEMQPTGERFEAVVPAVEDDFSYRVNAATLVSEDYEVTAVFPPGVQQIDVAYQYPAFANLPPRVEPDGGDIYAPEGTEVTVRVQMDKPIRGGRLEFGTGGQLPLTAVETRVLETTFTVSTNDTYRLAAVDLDDLSSTTDTDYFIRTVTDRPPEVEVTRPGGDRDITALEEVVIQATARDDFGLERFDLVYAVVGQAGRSVSLLSGAGGRDAHGRFTLYGEELELVPGDFISYYVRALDTNTGSGAGEVRSDIYFLEVRPFDQEFEEAQSQSSSAMDVDDVGNLAEVQKEIIVATWRLDQQPAGDRRSDDLAAVADAQEELRWAASRLAQRILSRGRQITPDTRGRASVEMEAMRQAVEAMATAEVHLRAEETDQAVPPEMDALNQLLRAQAEIRRRQVASQQTSDGGQPGENQAREDLSALFDEALRRDQQTNYESRSSPREEEREDSEAQQRLRELAERQQDLARQQQELADREDALDDDDVRRQLERLTREQNALREQLEDLNRQLEQTRAGAESSGGEQTGISEQMRRALSDLRRGDLTEASRRSQDAADRLRELQQQSEGPSGDAAAVGELRLEAQQLAELQRQMADNARRAGVEAASQPRRESVADRGDELADRVNALEDRLREAVSSSPAARDALTAASDELQAEDVAEQTREIAGRLRDVGRDPSGASDARRELAEIAAESDGLSEVLDRVAGRLTMPGEQNGRAQQLSEELEAARRLRQSLEQLEQRLQQVAAGPDPAPSETSPESPDGNERLVSPESGAGQEGQLAQLQEQLLHQLAENPELLDRLRRERPAAAEEFERWSQDWQSGPAPGTEAFKQDLSAWESLRDGLLVALEGFVATRSRELRDEELGGRLHMGQSERMPEEYRRLVEQYYQSIATQSQRP